MKFSSENLDILLRKDQWRGWSNTTNECRTVVKLKSENNSTCCLKNILFLETVTGMLCLGSETMTDFDRVKCDTATVNELNEEHLEEATRDEHRHKSWLNSLLVPGLRLHLSQEDGGGGGVEADCRPVPPDDGDPRPHLPHGERDQPHGAARGYNDICAERQRCGATQIMSHFGKHA